MENKKQDINLEDVRSKTIDEAKAEFKRNSKEIIDLAVKHNKRDLADDAIKNVKAVKQVLEQFDVKSDVQQAIVKSSLNLNKDFNEIEPFGANDVRRQGAWINEYKRKKLGK